MTSMKLLDVLFSSVKHLSLVMEEAWNSVKDESWHNGDMQALKINQDLADWATMKPNVVHGGAAIWSNILSSHYWEWGYYKSPFGHNRVGHSQ